MSVLSKFLFPLAGSALLAGLLLCGGCADSSDLHVSGDSGTAGAATNDLLWSASYLLEQMQTRAPLVILDCRSKKSRAADGSYVTPYNIEHIEGSFFLDMWLFGDPYPTANGVQANVEARLSELGITTDTTICLYDNGIENPQGKVFFNLERQGCTDVHILDGGFPVWKGANGPVCTAATPLPAPSVFVPAIDNTSYMELNNQLSENVGQGDGTPTPPSMSNLLSPPVRPSSITVTATRDDDAVMTATDDGSGAFAGDCSAGAIDYSSGAFTTLITFTGNVKTGTSIQVAYEAQGVLGMKAVFDMVYNGTTNSYTLSDYREPELWYGHKICPDAARHGWIPNSTNLNWKNMFNSANGLWKTRAELEDLFAATGLKRDKINVII